VSGGNHWIEFKIMNGIILNQLAFKMYLKPNSVKEYKKRHDEIWPELKELLKEAGVGAYHIYHDPETNCLFAIQETDGSDSQSLGENPIIQKWWEYMSDLMETQPDHSPKQLKLNQVFSL
jgi:L-rhamnose mutarotase